MQDWKNICNFAKTFVMPKLRLLFPAMVLCVLAVGCGAYNPVCTDIPLISQRGELQAEGAILPGGNNYRSSPLMMRGSLVYGFANHFAAGISADPFRHYGQLTAGTFFAPTDKFVWEMYAGYGLGNGELYRDYDPGESDYSSYQMHFVQLNAGWLNLTRVLHLDIAFSLKAGGIFVETNFGDGTEYSDEIGWYRRFHYANGYRFMLEPTAEVRFGWEHFKFNVKLGFTYVFNNTGNHYVLPYSSPAVGAGVSLRFAPCKNN